MSDRGPHSSSTPSAAGRSRRSGVIVFALALMALGIAACDGDTLYQPTDPGDPNGPTPPPGTTAVHLSMHVDAPDRIELTDSIRIRVTGWDPAAQSPIDSVGFSAVVRSLDSGETRTFSQKAAFQGAPGDTVSATFFLHPEWLTPQDLPSTFLLELYGLAFNRAGQCAAVVPGVEDRFGCRTIQVDGVTLRVGQAKAADITVQAVPGRTTPFPSNPVIVGDLQVDTVRQVVFVSNRASNRLHIFRPAAHAWDPDVSVGSEPWGLHFNATGDTLLVANSGGTSVSHVSLAGTPQEVVANRLQTRNTSLYEIELNIMEDSINGVEVADTLVDAFRFFDFSDRPQYVAQDAAGRLLYSTRPTGAAPRGTVRVIERQAGWPEHETRILARIPQDTNRNEGMITVLHADSIVFYIGGLMEVWDHRPGFPGTIVRSGIQEPLDALRFMSADPNSDVEWLLDSEWALENVSFADTTYVATSRDRSFVGFGDGGQPDVGRVVLWHSNTATITRVLNVADLVDNASERVRALELNRTGNLAIARGREGVYFFSNDEMGLRLRGTASEGMLGGGGAALHPDHPNVALPGAPSPQTLAFTTTGDRMLRILDTVHYQERGRIPLRDAVAGPFRVTPPLASDNNGQGRNCTGSACVVAKVFAVTTGGGVVVVDVHASDIQPLP